MARHAGIVHVMASHLMELLRILLLRGVGDAVTVSENVVLDCHCCPVSFAIALFICFIATGSARHVEHMTAYIVLPGSCNTVSKLRIRLLFAASATRSLKA
jgi:hypothetical protein